MRSLGIQYYIRRVYKPSLTNCKSSLSNNFQKTISCTKLPEFTTLRLLSHESSRKPQKDLVDKFKLILELEDRNVSTITVERVVSDFCRDYSSIDKGDKENFLVQLAANLNVDSSKVKSIANMLIENGSEKTIESMRTCLVPPQNFAFRKIGQIKGGVKFLVDMRRDIVQSLKALDVSSPNQSRLKNVDKDLKSLLSNWFSVGLLELSQVTWDSPTSLLQKVSDLEAVHPVKNWTDLKARVGLYRRCFVYTHPSMPQEPMVILHVALTESIASSITSLVKDHRAVSGLSQQSAHRWTGFEETEEDLSLCKAANFYSITSTQVGLQGIELGNHLIKGAVALLSKECSHLREFSTLSPIPGFRSWLLMKITQEKRGDIEDSSLLSSFELEELQDVFGVSSKEDVLNQLSQTIKETDWVESEETMRIFQRLLPKLCARYLYLEKRRNFALNSVANFHLRNGSCLWRINWLADPSPRGMQASCGLMVNYRYFLDRLEHNSNNYLENFTIDADQQVLSLIREDKDL